MLKTLTKRGPILPFTKVLSSAKLSFTPKHQGCARRHAKADTASSLKERNRRNLQQTHRAGWCRSSTCGFSRYCRDGLPLALGRLPRGTKRKSRLETKNGGRNENDNQFLLIRCTFVWKERQRRHVERQTLCNAALVSTQSQLTFFMQ